MYCLDIVYSNSLIRNRNCLPFVSIWLHSGFLWCGPYCSSI